MLSDVTVWLKKQNSRKGLNFDMWASFHLRNIALKFFVAGLLFVFEK